MARFTYSSLLPHSPEEVFAWHDREGAFLRLTPPWEAVRVGEKTGAGVAAGTRVSFSVKTGPMWMPWTARHVEYDPPRMFADEQEQGPFARWRHVHRFLAGENGTRMQDEIEYGLPLPPLGSLFGKGMARRRLLRMFPFRHRIVARDLFRHLSPPASPPLTVAITGASGLLGRSLIPFLTTGGHRVVSLVRRAPQPGGGEIFWDPARGELDPASLAGVDAVVHLAGENIGEGRWTREKKLRMVGSRTLGTETLARAVAAAMAKNGPRVLVSASAVGYYGHRADDLLDEGSPQGRGFIPELCAAWEQAARPAADAGVRVVNLRIGVVLSPAGGALAKMLPGFSAGLGAAMGPGSQYIPWVSPDDVLGAILHAMKTPALSGPVNLTAPAPVTSRELAQELGRVLSRPALFTLPATVLKAAFGRMAEEILLASARAVPQKLLDSGFVFLDPALGPALAHVLGRDPGPGVPS
ncbi:MAG: TIGR01777 family oxidoreductase [Proteobacteria bacterium]|nr:TIGR01777 family oxidoreductase [Pseudomonadota bacterium]